MTELKTLLPTKLFDILDRARISTPSQIFVMSVWEIKRLTNLCIEDISLVKNVVANHLCPRILTGTELMEQELKNPKIKVGCNEIDVVLRGGFRRRSITELYGESGSGKTQIAIQAVLHNCPNYSVYICTEDLFPIKRFEEIKKNIQNKPDVEYGKHVYVEHITESNDLLSCLRVRLPKLLSQNNFSLIVLDSIAAPFRCENTNYIQRAEELRELAILLLKAANKHNLAVVCINQVTASIESGKMLPALGLAWSNMISTRLWIRKTSNTVDIKQMIPPIKLSSSCNFNVPERELCVIFAPHLPNLVVKFIITSNGVMGVSSK